METYMSKARRWKTEIFLDFALLILDRKGVRNDMLEDCKYLKDYNHVVVGRNVILS